MTRPEASAPPSARFLPALLLLFIGSGCAALIYEIVWLQVLQLMIGSSAVSLGVLLGTFMGGMCLGSLAFARFVSTRRHPLRVYACLEIGIGLLGIILLFVMPRVGHAYASIGGTGFAGILLRGLVCAICLLPPTLLMGATLPAISRWVQTTPRGVSWLGFFYGGNIAGAVGGCLLAGFYLLRVHDMPTATWVAAAINTTVALLALALASLTPHQILANDSNPPDAPPARGAWPVYVAIALSGMTALGAEVIWTRLLSLMIGGTAYTFSIILAVFLTGLGIGSTAGSAIARQTRHAKLALGVCQFLLMIAIAWTTVMLARSVPYWPVDPSISGSPWYNFQLDLARCLWAILPATCLWGASFPLALAAVAAPGQDPARLVGRVYAANTVGAIIGALCASLLLIAWLGTRNAQCVLVGIAALAALVMLLASLSRPSAVQAGSSEAGIRPVGQFAVGVGAVATLVLAVVLILHLPAIPWGLVTEGRYFAVRGNDGKLLFMGEGMNASVAVTETKGGVRNFHVSGKIEASTEPRDMRLQRMLGHIPALLHPQPASVLIVGCGAGVTAGSFVTYPNVEHITICEIEPLIPRVVATYFDHENYGVVTNSRTRIVFDDARNFVLTTKQKFDIITSDPIHPWVKGAATLYTKEYFEICKQHLNPGGLVTQWVPLYESNPEVVKSEIATFFEVFPDGTIWSNDDHGKGYDIVLLGRADAGPDRIDVDAIQHRLNREDYARVAESLHDVNFETAVDLLATYAGRGPDLQPWLKDAQINRDRDLRLQYLAGMAPNLYEEGIIFDGMSRFRKFPEDLFAASASSIEALRLEIQTRTKAY